MSVFNLQFGDFYATNPNWFDWLSLFVSVLAILFAYYLGEKTYKRDKKDRETESEAIMESENKLFQSSLTELNKGIAAQIQYLKEYIEKKDLHLQINTSVNIDFLKFVDVKALYKKAENNTEKVNQINQLLTSLYGLSDFKRSLTDELRSYINKYNGFEAIFKENYREVFYTKVAEINNHRAINFINDDQGKRWQYNEADKFMREYMTITNSFESNVKSKGNNVDRVKVESELLKLKEMSKKYIPEDYDAIVIQNLATKSHDAFQDIKALDNTHFIAVKSHLEILEGLQSRIEPYLAKEN